MTSKNYALIIVCFILLACAGILYKNYTASMPLRNSPAGEENSGGVPVGWTTYTNTDYGFQVSYPENLQATTTFQSYYHLPSLWRLGALTDSDGHANGNAVLSIPVYRIDKSKNGAFTSYPMYFDAELRIGASRDPKDVATCLEADPGYTVTSTPVVINGAVFHKFSLQDAAMMQYVKNESYRTVHGGVCFAMEELETGSSYRDIATSSDDIPDSVLNSYYDQIAPIVQAFIFLSAPEVRGTPGAPDVPGSPAGMHCGGFIKNAPVCPAGYHCKLNIIADTGGVCVKD